MIFAAAQARSGGGGWVAVPVRRRRRRRGRTINKFYAGVWKNRNVTIYDNKM